MYNLEMTEVDVEILGAIAILEKLQKATASSDVRQIKHCTKFLVLQVQSLKYKVSLLSKNPALLAPSPQPTLDLNFEEQEPVPVKKPGRTSAASSSSSKPDVQ